MGGGYAEYVVDSGDFAASAHGMIRRDLEGHPAMSVTDQLMKGVTVEDLYDFLFGLEYLKPRFKLLWRKKPLDQLSPGERGTFVTPTRLSMPASTSQTVTRLPTPVGRSRTQPSPS